MKEEDGALLLIHPAIPVLGVDSGSLSLIGTPPALRTSWRISRLCAVDT